MKNWKKVYLTNGSIIAIWMVMVLACLPIMGLPMVAKAEQQQSTPPCEGDGCLPDEKKFLVDDWDEAKLDYFVTGESDEIVLNHNPKTTAPLSEAEVFDKVAAFLNAPENKHFNLVLLGTVSDLEIRGGCYSSKDHIYFKLKSRAIGVNSPSSYNGVLAYTTNDDCQSELSLSRSHRYRQELINRKVDGRRINILNMPTLAMDATGNYPNQAVWVWKMTPRQLKDFDSNTLSPGGGEPLSFYLRMDIPDDCYLRTNTVFNGEYYEVQIKVIRKADSGRTQSTATTNNGDESYCKQHPYICGIGGSAVVLGVVYGLLCIKGGDATKDGKTAEGGTFGGCWLEGGP